MKTKHDSLAVIRAALMRGQSITTADGNRIARTTETRKIISRLRRSGMPIEDRWQQDGRRRWKVYYYPLTRPLGWIGSLIRWIKAC